MTDERSRGVGRRSFTKAACATLLGSAMASRARAQNGSDGTEPESDRGQDGDAVDFTGEEEAVVEVGTGGAGFRFDPADVVVNPGTTVVWRWTGNGGQHNVAHSDGDRAYETQADPPMKKGADGSAPLFSSVLIGEQGHEFTYTFEETGVYDYVCAVHVNQGMVGSVIVVDESFEAFVGGPDTDSVRVNVSEGDGGFDPANIVIDSGTTVRWVWNGGAGQARIAHSTGEEPLENPVFEGMLGGEGKSEFSHTFNESGTYDYVSDAHGNRSGTIIIVDELSYSYDYDQPAPPRGGSPLTSYPSWLLLIPPVLLLVILAYVFKKVKD